MLNLTHVNQNSMWTPILPEGTPKLQRGGGEKRNERWRVYEAESKANSALLMTVWWLRDEKPVTENRKDATKSK